MASDDLPGRPKDLLVLLAALGVLLATTAALFPVTGITIGPDPDRAGVSFWTVTFHEERHAIDLGSNASAQIQEGQTMRVPVPVHAANVTLAKVTLEWDMAGTGDVSMDRFELEVRPPGEAVTCEAPNPRSGTSGSLELGCRGVSLPDDEKEVVADGPDEAIAKVNAKNPANRSASGVYEALVTLEDEGGDPLQDGNGYTVTAFYQDYHPEAQAAGEDVFG